MGQAEKEQARRRTIEAAYVHPPATIAPQRLSFADAGLSRRTMARKARLVGFDVLLLGSYAHEPPTWHKRNPDDVLLDYWSECVLTLELQGARAVVPDLGLLGFRVTWRGRRGPEVWLKFARWPWVKSNATALGAFLDIDIAHMRLPRAIE